MKFWMAILLTIGGCAGSAAYWWDRDHALWQPPAALRPDVAGIQPLPQSAPVTATESVARPPLWATRRPPRARTQEDRLLEELNQSYLLAVVQSGPRSVALLRAPDGRLVRYDDQSRPWRLESFNGRQGVFVTPEGKRVTRPLQPPPAAAPSRAPAPRR